MDKGQKKYVANFCRALGVRSLDKAVSVLRFRPQMLGRVEVTCIVPIYIMLCERDEEQADVLDSALERSNREDKGILMSKCLTNHVLQCVEHFEHKRIADRCNSLVQRNP